jgi:hypothetical protein
LRNKDTLLSANSENPNNLVQIVKNIFEKSNSLAQSIYSFSNPFQSIDECITKSKEQINSFNISQKNTIKALNSQKQLNQITTLEENQQMIDNEIQNFFKSNNQ